MGDVVPHWGLKDPTPHNTRRGAREAHAPPWCALTHTSTQPETSRKASDPQMTLPLVRHRHRTKVRRAMAWNAGPGIAPPGRQNSDRAGGRAGVGGGAAWKRVGRADSQMVPAGQWMQVGVGRCRR